jgi:hypothetical protein
MNHILIRKYSLFIVLFTGRQKVKALFVIIKYYTMKTKGGAGADPQLLTSALDGGE